MTEGPPSIADAMAMLDGLPLERVVAIQAMLQLVSDLPLEVMKAGVLAMFDRMAELAPEALKAEVTACRALMLQMADAEQERSN